MLLTNKLSRRTLLKGTAATGATAAFAGVNMFNVNTALAALPNPADVLAKINVGTMVNKAYREQYKLGDNDELWDPKKDWIRNDRMTSIDFKTKSMVIDEKLFATFADTIPKNLNVNSAIKVKGRFVGFDGLLEEMKIDQCVIITQ